MDFRALLKYLQELSMNNDRDWFHANKAEYDRLRKDFESFVDTLILRIASFDDQISGVTAKDCIFRIFRDTRFSHDKTPYKTNFGAYIAAGGRKSEGAGYYFHIEPKGCFVAGGVYMPSSEQLKAIRMEILYEYKAFRSIIGSTSFKKHFGQLQESDKLSRPPKDFPADFEGIEYLKLKNYFVMHSFPDSSLHKASFLDEILLVYKAMLPLNAFLRKASS